MKIAIGPQYNFIENIPRCKVRKHIKTQMKKTLCLYKINVVLKLGDEYVSLSLFFHDIKFFRAWFVINILPHYIEMDWINNIRYKYQPRDSLISLSTV
jgi:hypothetical protein